MNTISPQLNKTVKPRHAASLVIYERRDDDIYLLMGKRAKGHKFLPNVFVFPGGRIDTADHASNALKPLEATTAQHLASPGDMATAVAVAAVRETHEETGLVIGDIRDGKLHPDLSGLEFVARAITPAHNPIRFNTRFLMVDAQHTSGEIAGSGELLELQWFSIKEALAMPLVDVTEFVVAEIRDRLEGTLPSPHQYPLFTYLNGRPVIRRIAL
jgi:8-oxo-dGTP pyrophosphatase MutT (NUDIX family)